MQHAGTDPHLCHFQAMEDLLNQIIYMPENSLFMICLHRYAIRKNNERTSNSENLLTDDPPLYVEAKILRKHKYEDIL